MNKPLTIIASLAFGTAVSQAAVLCATSFNRTGAGLNSVTVNTVSSYGISSPTTIEAGDFTKSGPTAGGQSGKLLGQNTIPSTVITPNSNVSSGGSWSISFTFTNNNSSDMLISSIDLSMIGVNGSGAAQNGGNGTANNGYVGGQEGNTNKPVDITLSIGGQENKTLAYNGATSTNTTSGSWDGIHTGSYEYDNLLLQAGESLTITIAASKNSAYDKGCFMGLTGIQLNGELAVPEPASASLGLLGVAGFMMRRRRR